MHEDSFWDRGKSQLRNGIAQWIERESKATQCSTQAFTRPLSLTRIYVAGSDASRHPVLNLVPFWYCYSCTEVNREGIHWKNSPKTSQKENSKLEGYWTKHFKAAWHVYSCHLIYLSLIKSREIKSNKIWPKDQELTVNAKPAQSKSDLKRRIFHFNSLTIRYSYSFYITMSC